MPKYINADKIISHLNDEIEACEDPDVYAQPVAYGTRFGLEYSKSLVETAEPADVQEVNHGKWIRDDDQDGFRCPNCGHATNETLLKWYQEINSDTCNICYRSVSPFYCSRCGAKMDLED